MEHQSTMTGLYISVHFGVLLKNPVYYEYSVVIFLLKELSTKEMEIISLFVYSVHKDLL